MFLKSVSQVHARANIEDKAKSNQFNTFNIYDQSVIPFYWDDRLIVIRLFVMKLLEK